MRIRFVETGATWYRRVLPEFPLHVIVGRESIPAVCLQAGVSGFPRGIRGEQLRHVGLRAARLSGVVKVCRVETHQVGSSDVGVGLRERELNPLVLADRPREYDPFPGVAACCPNEPITVSDAFRRNQDPLGVQAVQQRPESFALLADQVFRRALRDRRERPRTCDG